jgi:SAM-dependent methyltransferase
MDSFALPERDYDAALVYDALHHSEHPELVVRQIARHLKPNGWVLFGEPSWLHDFSPGAHETEETLGWVERGIRVSHLRQWCRAAGLRHFRRFYEGTEPYEGRLLGFGWQLARLVAANLWVAPRTSIWLAAQKALAR